jgi:DNA-binding beta-propeller fold protein YncE
MHKARAFVIVCAGLLCLLPPAASAQTPTYLYQWGTSGTGNGQFDQPTGVAVDASGHVYVVDTRNQRVEKLTGEGTCLTKWGTHGPGPGQFHYPRGVAVDASGNIYVAEMTNCRIQVFGSARVPTKPTT